MILKSEPEIIVHAHQLKRERDLNAILQIEKKELML